jgi:D-beta-D-heptose 7-phosphate kinase/D-beta-D-heptose 1-phosphate adenosyltransferase
VSSDRSVRANKGPDRPINREEERVEILLALASVDVAVIFDEDTPLAVMTAIQPDILVKGPDRVTDNIEGREVVEVRGGRVIRVELAPEFSTTDLIGRRQPGRPS